MRAPRSRWSRRITVVVFTGAAATFACQPIASAHISVSPDSTPAGVPAVLSFRVPSERDDVTTTRLEVTFPADHPLGSVVPRTLPGWKIEVRKQTTTQRAESAHADEMTDGTVSSIVWESGVIPAGTFEDFPVRIAKMPGSGTLGFVVRQTYSDGQTILWSDPVRQGQPEPAHPAPTVTVEPPTSATAPEKSTSDTPARMLGGAGLAAGFAAAAAAVLRRRPVHEARMTDVAGEPDVTRS
ncbi:YcnI family protein [Amycolatopsis sp. NPDC059027]|uniref:YcnI family copper-binding membrane protein n=1 Tax=unclassified Amycolatopsis TaxID=2618356 RepID=UPI0036707985